MDIIQRAALLCQFTWKGSIPKRLETGDEGYAIFFPIVRGAYTADVSKAGFLQTRVTDLLLEVDERKLVRVTLQVASVTETVEVSAAADIYANENREKSAFIESFSEAHIDVTIIDHTGPEDTENGIHV